MKKKEGEKVNKEEKQEFKAIVFPKIENKPNVLYIRLSDKVFKHVYAIAKETDSNMSEVARLCIESKLKESEKLLREIKELKSGFGKK